MFNAASTAVVHWSPPCGAAPLSWTIATVAQETTALRVRVLKEVAFELYRRPGDNTASAAL